MSAKRRYAAGTLCSEAGCSRPAYAKDKCKKHYQHDYDQKRPPRYIPRVPRKQKVPKVVNEQQQEYTQCRFCQRPVNVKSRGLCYGHYTRLLKGRPLEGPIRTDTIPPLVCSYPDCKGPVHARGMCGAHYRQTFMSTEKRREIRRVAYLRQKERQLAQTG